MGKQGGSPTKYLLSGQFRLKNKKNKKKFCEKHETTLAQNKNPMNLVFFYLFESRLRSHAISKLKTNNTK